jgi:hypothetical protein
MSEKMLGDIRDIYINSIHDADLIEEEIVTTISYGMFYEGKTVHEVLDFLADSEGDEIIEKFEEILDTVEKENITESTVFSEEVELFVEEQAQQLDEFVGAALRVGAAALKGLRFAKGAKGFAPLARLAGGGKAAKTAIGRISKQGVRQSSVVRKALEPVTSRIKSGAAAVRAQASKLPAPVKGFIKGTGKVLKNVGIPAAAGVAGYMLGKGSSEAEAEAPQPSGPKKDEKPAYPGGQTEPEGEAINKKYQELRTAAVDPKGKIKDPEAVKKAEDYGKAQWAKLYPNLAAKVKPDGTQKGTGQSKMEKDAAEIRAMQKASQERQEADKKKVKKEAYEVVLDYLLSEGHADTVEEAHYVMMQMDSDYIQSIVAESGYFPTKESQRRDRERYNLSTGDLPQNPRKPIKRNPDGTLKTEQMMPPIDPLKHKQAQKTQKIYNLGKGTNNPNEAQSAMKRTGAQLPPV